MVVSTAIIAVTRHHNAILVIVIVMAMAVLIVIIGVVVVTRPNRAFPPKGYASAAPLVVEGGCERASERERERARGRRGESEREGLG